MLKLMLALSLAGAPSKHRVRIAVLDVEQTSNQADRARLLTQVLVGDLPKLGDFEVIGSAEIRQLLGFERQKQLLGCKEDSCLAELGGALGVDDLLLGQLGKLGSRYRFDLRLIDARRSRVVASAGDFVPDDDDALANATERMLRSVLADAGLRKADASSGEQPAGGLTEATPEAPSHTAAWITAGGAVLFAAGATFMTLRAQSRFDDAHACFLGQKSGPCDQYSPDSSSHLADALWVGTAALAGASTYLFLSAPSSGSGGEVGVRGTF